MQLKEQSGLSYPYISEIENGGKYPSQRAIQSLADALNMTPSELVARAEQLEAVELSVRSAEAGGSLADDPVTAETLARPRGVSGLVQSDAANLVQRLTEQVMQAIEAPLRDLVAREVQMTIREELLRQRDGK